MQILLAVVVGSLYAAGVYMLMRRNIVKLIIGLSLLGHAANLLIFTVSALQRAQPAFIWTEDAIPSPETFVDPLPQALILTAIVIGFGVQAFALVLIKRVSQTTGTDDLDEIRGIEVL